jgi:hypothetical protein
MIGRHDDAMLGHRVEPGAGRPTGAEFCLPHRDR